MTSSILLFLWPFLCIMTQHKSSSMLQHYLSLYVLQGAHCVGSSLPCVLHHGCKINSIQSVQIIERRTKTNEPIGILSLDIQGGYPWISILHNSIVSVWMEHSLLHCLRILFLGKTHLTLWRHIQTSIVQQNKSWNHLHISFIVSFSDQSLGMRLPYP